MKRTLHLVALAVACLLAASAIVYGAASSTRSPVPVRAPLMTQDRAWPPSNAVMRQVAKSTAVSIARRTGMSRVRVQVVPMGPRGMYAFRSSARVPWRVGTISMGRDGRGFAYPAPDPVPVDCCRADTSR